MILRSLLAMVGLVLGLSVVAQEQPTQGDYVVLVDPLDEPEFYCFDLAGWGQSLQIEDPLQTHTCKGRNAADQMFHFDGNRLKASDYDRCVQVAGSGVTTLPGSAILVRPCAEDSPRQALTMDDRGRIKLVDSDYCLAAGATSIPASGPSHLWRTLTVENCDSASGSLITWTMGMN